MKIVVTRMSGLFITIFLVVANAVLIEVIMDLFSVNRHRLITGIAGTLLIIISFTYSMRKRKKLLTVGSPKYWLQAHEWLSIGGTFIIFVHTGTHLTAMVPVITLIFMVIAFVSGLVGRYVYNNVKADLKDKKMNMKKDGIEPDEIELKLWALTVSSDALSKWRAFHMPVISFLSVMVIYHAISALYYAGF